MSQETKKEEEFENDDLGYINKNKQVILETHTMINRYLCGELKKMEKGYVEVELQTEDEMVVDKLGLIHGGFVFSAADFAAMAAVNEKNVVLVATDCQFLSPVKLGDVVLVKAQLKHQEGRKRNVHVKAFVHDIKVFEGDFMTVITERHVLRLKLATEENNEN